MRFEESENVEFKKIVTEDIKKEVIAFANGLGGVIYVGVSDDGDVQGLEHPDQVMQQLANMIRDSIKPDVTLFIRFVVEDAAGQRFVAVHV